MAQTTASMPPAPLKRERGDHRIGHQDPLAQRVWDHVSHSPLQSLWNFQGAPPWTILKRTAKSFIDDDLLSRAAELGFYFLFALFPLLICGSAIAGLALRGSVGVYEKLLNYLAMVVPASAYDLVINTFNQTTAAATSGKITLGLVASLWSASVGFAAIQDTLNLVYKVKETRPYWKARGSAILVTILLAIVVTINLADLLGGDIFARYAYDHISQVAFAGMASMGIHILTWIIACGLLMLSFSIIYYYAPALKTKCWHWLTPGAAIGIITWLLASIGFRVYLHFFNTYSVTYGSLGAVIILLMWFYISGLTLLAGAEINSEIQAAVAEKKLKEAGQLPPQATTDPEHPVQAETSARPAA